MLGSTSSSPATIKAVNLNISGNLIDVYVDNIPFMADAAINITEPCSLAFGALGRLTTLAGSAASFMRPMNFYPLSNCANCGFENNGNTSWTQTYTSHQMAVNHDNLGVMDFSGTNIGNSLLLITFSGRNLLPESQRKGGVWKFRVVSSNPAKPSILWSMNTYPYNTSALAYDFGANWSFQYPQGLTTILAFTNGDYYFRSTSTSFVRYSSWRHASIEIDPSSTTILSGVSGVNFGARQRGATESTSLTARLAIGNYCFLSGDGALPVPSQFLIDQLLFANDANISNWRLAPSGIRNMNITFYNGSSYIDSSIFATPNVSHGINFNVGVGAGLTLTSTSFPAANIPLYNYGTVRFVTPGADSATSYPIVLNRTFIQYDTGTLLLTVPPVAPSSGLQPSLGQYVHARHVNSTFRGAVGLQSSGLIPAGFYNVIRVPRGTKINALSSASTMTFAQGYYTYATLNQDEDGLTEWIGFKVAVIPAAPTSDAPAVPAPAPGLSESANSGNGAAIIGGILGPLLAIALAVGIFLFIRRRRQQKKAVDEEKLNEDVEKGKADKSAKNNSSNYGPVGITSTIEPTKKKAKKNDGESSETSDEAPPNQYGAIASSDGKLERTVSGIDQSKKLLKQKKQDDWQIPFEDLSFERELGSGAFGSVWKGLWNMAPVAIKQSLLVSASATQQADFEHEAKLMTKLRPHPNVVHTFGLSVAKDRILLVMEYCARGSLTKYFKKEKTPLSVERKIKVVSDLAKGISHLHKNGIVHRDLAARNVLITKDWTAKISDFGMSRLIGNSDNKGTTASNIGPVRWMAPEAIRTKEYSAKTDVWSFGITVWEIFLEAEPHAEMDLLDAAIKIRDEKCTPVITDAIPAAVQELLQKCWQSDPESRPTFDEIVKECGALAENSQSESSSEDE